MKDVRSTFFSMVFASLVACAGATQPASAQEQQKTADSAGYSLIRKSPAVKDVEFRRGKKKGSVLVITVGEKVTDLQNSGIPAMNAIGTKSTAQQQQPKGPEFDRIDMIEGRYGDIKVEKKSNTQNTYTITDITFPLRLLMYSGTDFVEFRLAEPAKWNIEVNYKK